MRPTTATTASPAQPEPHDPLTGGHTRRDAERALVAGLLMGHSDAYEAAATIIGPADLTGMHRDVWLALGAAHRAGVPIEAIDWDLDATRQWGTGPHGPWGAAAAARRVKVHALREQLAIAADDLARHPEDHRAARERLDAIAAELDAQAVARDELLAAWHQAAAAPTDAAKAAARHATPMIAAARSRYSAMDRDELLACVPRFEPTTTNQETA